MGLDGDYEIRPSTPALLIAASAFLGLYFNSCELTQYTCIVLIWSGPSIWFQIWGSWIRVLKLGVVDCKSPTDGGG